MAHLHQNWFCQDNFELFSETYYSQKFYDTESQCFYIVSEEDNNISITEITKENPRLWNATNREYLRFKRVNGMPKELIEKLKQFEELSSCGSIRSYYDGEAPKQFEYEDSAVVHSFLFTAEEMAHALLDGEVDMAEELIKDFIKGFGF